MKVTLDVVAHLQDDQSGGYDVTIYPSMTHFWESFDEIPTKKKKKEILDGADEYENGKVVKTLIEVEIDRNGNGFLAAPIHLHAGQ